MRSTPRTAPTPTACSRGRAIRAYTWCDSVFVAAGVIASLLVHRGGVLVEAAVSPLQLVELLVSRLLEIHQVVVRARERADQLVELELDRVALAVLGVLDQEHHQERHDRRAGVDRQLPA